MSSKRKCDEMSNIHLEAPVTKRRKLMPSKQEMYSRKITANDLKNANTKSVERKTEWIAFLNTCVNKNTKDSGLTSDIIIILSEYYQPSFEQDLTEIVDSLNKNDNSRCYHKCMNKMAIDYLIIRCGDRNLGDFVYKIQRRQQFDKVIFIDDCSDIETDHFDHQYEKKTCKDIIALFNEHNLMYSRYSGIGVECNGIDWIDMLSDACDYFNHRALFMATYIEDCQCKILQLSYHEFSGYVCYESESDHEGFTETV
eukprot:307457_1